MISAKTSIVNSQIECYNSAVMTAERDRLKIATVAPYLMGEKNIGGVQNYITSLSPELERKGCDITVIGSGARKQGENLVDETVGFSIPFSMTNTSYKGTVFINLIIAKKLMQKVDPDVVWFHDPFASPVTSITLLQGLALSRSNAVTDLIVHAYTQKLTQTNKRLIMAGNLSGVTGFIARRIDGRGAVSPPPAELWSRIMKEDADKYTILPNPINTEFFTPVGAIFEDWGQDGSKILFFAGRHDKRKRLCDAIDALAILIRLGVKAKLMIAGNGDETKNAKKQVKRLGLEGFIEFLGFVTNEDLAKAYRTVGKKRGIFVASSEDGEAFNRTIAEARASGALVAATNIHGHRFSYGDERIFGEMTEPKDPQDLAAKIKAQLDLPKELQGIRQELGVKFVRGNFSLPIVAQEVIKHHEKLLSLRKSDLRKRGVIYRK